MFIQIILNFCDQIYIVGDYCCRENRQIIIWGMGLVADGRFGYAVCFILCTVPFLFLLTKTAVVCVIIGFPPYHRCHKGHGYLYSSLPWPHECLAYLLQRSCLILVSHIYFKISKICVLEKVHDVFVIVSVSYISHKFNGICEDCLCNCVEPYLPQE